MESQTLDNPGKVFTLVCDARELTRANMYDNIYLVKNTLVQRINFCILDAARSGLYSCVFSLAREEQFFNEHGNRILIPFNDVIDMLQKLTADLKNLGYHADWSMHNKYIELKICWFPF